MSSKPAHPLALPLLFAVAAAIFGLIYWLFGIGGKAFEWLLTLALFYGGIVVVTFALGGLIWGILKLLRR